uniref:T cell leukemia translocation altered n=1 Tax=Leptobrachium leishanense TaxID=445787 RepID=A0A8C5PCS9_9ANUR
MEEAWDSEWMTQSFGYLFALSTEFTREWEASDMKATIFKVLLGWLVLSLSAIQLAWKFYGPTVNSIYYRQGERGALWVMAGWAQCLVGNGSRVWVGAVLGG